MTASHVLPKPSSTAKPLVSVVVPCFNGATFLREALDSMLAQTYPRIEILLLDDASTDDTPAIAAEYGDRITYVRQPVNCGTYENVNTGIARAKGELIATYHADDIYLPEYIAAGDRALAPARSLTNYDAHRSEDRLMAAISHYIKGERAQGRAALRDVRLQAVARSRQVQSKRLMVPFAAMWVLLRLPRIDALAKRMFVRWHVKRPRK